MSWMAAWWHIGFRRKALATNDKQTTNGRRLYSMAETRCKKGDHRWPTKVVCIMFLSNNRHVSCPSELWPPAAWPLSRIFEYTRHSAVFIVGSSATYIYEEPLFRRLKAATTIVTLHYLSVHVNPKPRRCSCSSSSGNSSSLVSIDRAWRIDSFVEHRYDASCIGLLSINKPTIWCLPSHSRFPIDTRLECSSIFCTDHKPIAGLERLSNFFCFRRSAKF